jgi:hypothetical protein
MQMQARMQQMAQAPPVPPAAQQQMEQAREKASKYGIDLDDLDLPKEDDWAENPNQALGKVLKQVNAKIAERIEEGVSSKVLGTIDRRQQVQANQQQSIQSAVGLYPQAQGNQAVMQTAGQILSNPQNAALRSMPMGPFFALVAAASVHGLSPVTAQQTAQKQGREQGAQAERSRQQRLKSGAMNTGGKEGGSTIKLDPMQKKIAKQMGVTEKAYAEAARQTAAKGGA